MEPPFYLELSCQYLGTLFLGLACYDEATTKPVSFHLEDIP